MLGSTFPRLESSLFCHVGLGGSAWASSGVGETGWAETIIECCALFNSVMEIDGALTLAEASTDMMAHVVEIWLDVGQERSVLPAPLVDQVRREGDRGPVRNPRVGPLGSVWLHHIVVWDHPSVGFLLGPLVSLRITQRFVYGELGPLLWV